MRTSKLVALGISGLIAIAVIVAALVPAWREKVREVFFHGGREVLATAEGDVLNDGSVEKIIKFKTPEGIYIEVLKEGPGNTTLLVDRILLPDKHDGLFNFQGHVTRLAIADVNQDGQNELLAPTFDDQLVPHLNVFRYNPAIGHFELDEPKK